MEGDQNTGGQITMDIKAKSMYFLQASYVYNNPKTKFIAESHKKNCY